MAVGSVYVLFVMPRIMKSREAETDDSDTDSGRQFIIELRLRYGDSLIGAETAAGFLPALSGMTLQMIESGGQTMLPPFDDHRLRAGDKLYIAATRREIADALAQKEHPLRDHLMQLVPNEGDSGEDLMLAELVVAPGSRMAQRAIGQWRAAPCVNRGRRPTPPASNLRRYRPHWAQAASSGRVRGALFVPTHRQSRGAWQRYKVCHRRAADGRQMAAAWSGHRFQSFAGSCPIRQAENRQRFQRR